MPFDWFSRMLMVCAFCLAMSPPVLHLVPLIMARVLGREELRRRYPVAITLAELLHTEPKAWKLDNTYATYTPLDLKLRISNGADFLAIETAHGDVPLRRIEKHILWRAVQWRRRTWALCVIQQTLAHPPRIRDAEIVE